MLNVLKMGDARRDCYREKEINFHGDRILQKFVPLERGSDILFLFQKEKVPKRSHSDASVRVQACCLTCLRVWDPYLPKPAHSSQTRT